MFASNPVPPSKSLLDLFPLVLQNTLLDIAQHEFLPFDLQKLNTHLRDNLDAVSGNTSSGSISQDFPNFMSLYCPLCTYFAILTTFAAASGDANVVAALSCGTFEYSNLLFSYTQCFEWDTVVRYHIAFHDVQRCKMCNGNYAGWGIPNVSLMGTRLFGYSKTCSTTSTSKSSSSSTRPSGCKPQDQQTCFNRNKGLCSKDPCPRGHIHHCKNCESPDHKEGACPKKT
ncbi:hypothetical protein K435DRAFT_660256 [Dendrothele bispora CBS 962.96]|uniref:Uncharacterized protein n=1 Tax=Dendrothele bispora (strain CBS 962.96) TaxID=1314807 RepID=A0A4S8M949_DENBC|nr:hypothetical protein K435DRAFT_660256 [Dendrothele bispora CBS 962.96]